MTPSAWLLILFYVFTSVYGDVVTYSATELPNVSSTRFPFFHIITPLNETGSGLEFYWNLENKGQDDEAVHFVLMLAGFPESPFPQALERAWMAIGWGPNMRNAEFIVCHQRIDNVEVHRHISSPHYEPPLREHQNEPFQVVNAGYVDGILFAEVKQPTRGVKPLITRGGSQDMIWAFNPKSGKLPDGQWFTYHGPNGPANQPFTQTHGALSVNFRSGVVVTRPLVAFKNLQIHGLGMSIVFLVLMPMGIYISRYLKSMPNWIHTHAAVQGTAAIGMAVFFGLVLATYQRFSGSHAQLGLVVVILVLFQVIFGGVTRLGMLKGDIKGFVGLRYLHRCTGTLIVILAVAQVGLGLNILYPPSFSRGREFWIVYGVVVALWMVAFVATEVYYYRLYRRSAPSTDEKAMLMNTKSDASRIPQDKLATLMHLQPSDSESLLKYTWKSLHEEIQKTGKVLVVANGKYVYDASQWIHSHPGGKVILYSVAGTDITMDYFREAGYDAAQFVPKPTAPPRSHTHQSPPQVDANAVVTQPEPVTDETILASLHNASVMTQENWEYVEKARRTHVHTRLALERLSKILVGEMIPDKESLQKQGSDMTLNTVGDALCFDPYEFRRYTMTEKVLLTDDGHAATKYYRIKFTSLYPYDMRMGQPTTFLFGQSVEIMVRLPNGRMVTRYYTPIDGNLTSFEIIVKITGGAMTSLFDKYRCGERQFKVRGPFGQSCLQPPAEYEMNYPVPPNIVFIVAGSGITPFLQFLKTAMLPVNEALSVCADYYPQAADEMQVNVGDYVATLSHYYDGWAFGTNLTTGAQGSFPLSIVTPAAGRNYKVTLIHCVQTTSDIVGRELMDAAISAYPQQLDIHHIVNDLSSGVRDGVTGYVREGRLDDRVLKELLCHIPSDGFSFGRRAVLCGPDRFNSQFVDVLMETLGWSQDEIQILSESTC